MSNKFEAAIQIGKGIYQFGKSVAKKLKGNKQTFTGQAINTTKPGAKLKFKRDEQDKFVKFRDNLYKSAKFDTATKNKLKSKQPLTKINKGKSDIFTPKEPKFSKGGRVGLKGGSFPDYSGDGKTTMKDILMGRGVIPKPKNKKKTMMAKKSKSPMDKAVRKA